MSYYKLFQVDIIQASQLYLGGGVNAGLPAAGLNLYSDGAGGTFWSSVSGGGTTNAITSSLLTSTVDGLGSAGYASTTYVTQTISTLSTLLGPAIAIGVAGSGPGGALTNSNLQSTVIGLGNFYISTNQVGLGNIVSFAQLYSTVAGITSNTNTLSSQTGLLTSSGFVSTYSLASTVTGLATSGYISTSQLTSTIVGLGNIYVSVNNVLFSPVVAVGLSTNYISSGLSYLGGVTINSNTFNAQNTPLTLGFTSNPGQNPITINGPDGSVLNILLNSGTADSLLIGVNQNNSYITASNNAIITTASVLSNIISSFIVQPNLLSNNNTQIIGSTISTGIVLANLFSGYHAGDGSLLTNVNAISSQTLTAYTQSTMVSTVRGLNSYLGYLSVNAIGPVVNTSSLNVSTLFTQGGISTAFLNMTNTLTSNIWVAVGASSNILGTIETSSDGLNWTNVLSGGFSIQGINVAWNGNLWVAVGQDANSNNTIQYSSNAVNWTSVATNGFRTGGAGIAWNGSAWVAVGYDSTAANTIKYSFDGINWSNSIGPGFSVGGNAVRWNGRLWVAAGQSATGSLLYSYNTSNWFVSAQTGYSSNLYALGWNGRFWLAGGLQSVGNNALSMSKDGVNWSNMIIPNIQWPVLGLMWNGVVWAMILNTSNIPNYYSYDGLKWLPATGTVFSAGGLDVDWNGNFFIATGQDAIQSSLIKQSFDGINWINSSSNNFVGAVQNLAFSSNVKPFYSQQNFSILPQNIPNYLQSTNQFLFSPNAMTINNTVYIDNRINRLGVNCNAPSYDLDVYGVANISSYIFASSFIGDGSLLTNLNAISTSALTSTIIGLGNFGYISTQVDYSSFAISTNALYNTSTLAGWFGSTTTNVLSRINLTSSVFISTSFSTLNSYTINASSLTTSSLLASTILTSNIFTSSANIQFGRISSLSTFEINTQRLLVSSLRFFDGDGLVQINDIQSSNISAIAMYTSSIAMNSLLASNIRVGNNSNMSPITFYGVRGGYANTAILEQSTSLSTQELLFFRGSSIGDQVRIQTTGGFRVETGVSGRLFPNMTQLSTTAFAIDAFSNVTMNNSTFYLNAPSSFVGINCNAPGVALDVAGTIRASQMIISSLTTSTIATSSAVISSLTTPLLTTQRLLVSSLRFYDGDGFVFTADVQHSNVSTIGLYASSIATGFLQSYTLISSPVIITSSLTINAMVLSSISTQVLGVNSLVVSSIAVSSVVAPLLTTQRLLVSSLRFYDGDGTIFTPDVQHSNVSTITIYTSSVLANTVTSSNIRLGFNQAQTPISFYGTLGNFNNTVIAEQSTGTVSQELLLFRGSSISDQVRIQTTGGFRVETGVTSRVFPNVGQLTTPPLLIDALSNVAVNGSNIYVLAANNFVGINCNTPGVALDVNGIIRGNGSLISNVNYGFLPAMSTSSLVVSSITAINASFSTLTLSSILQTNRLIASTISTQFLIAGQFSISSFAISTLVTPIIQSQAITTSSLAFYTGDGLINIPDLQGSNVSTGAVYASSITAPLIATSNLRVGSNTVQNSINFYGRTGAFNNTVIAEMSTGTVSQELLIFKGSSISDQVRVQTTGAFRVETGVSARLFSNVASNTTAPLLIDALSNVSMNGSNIYVLAANNFVGINCNTPGVALDVNGTLRATNAVLSNITFVTINTNSMNVSTVIVSSVLGVNTGYFSTAIPSTLYMNTLSSLYQVDFQNAIANFSSLSKVNVSPAIQNIWVAAGNGTNSLAYSLDGITWTGIATSAATFSVGGSNVAWNGARFVAVGQGTNSICYSANGSNWTPIANSATTFTTGAAAIAWNGSRFIAGGTGTNALAYSADGINWTGIALGATTFTTQTNGIAWNGKLWVAVGAGTNSIIYSADGLTWTGIASGVGTFSVGGFGIAWNGKLWVAVGQGTNSICYSVNGINWTPIANTQITTFTTQGFGVAWNGLRFVAVGQGTNTIIYSADGINWLPVPSSTTIFSSNGQNIAWNGIRWVATGFGTNTIAYSTDGINWTGIPTASSVFTNAGIGVGYSSNVFPAYAQQTLDMLPQNIPTFFRSTNQIFNSLSSMLLNDTLAIDRTYNYVGVNCNVPLYTLDVAGAANVSTFTKVNVQPYTVARWVAGGQGGNSIAYSADGISWTGVTGPFTATNAVAWNGVRWVAVGTGGVYAIAYSPDGINWTGIPVSTNTFTTGGRCVAWNNRLWVATGNGTNAIAYSSDGINWTGIPLSANTFTSAGTAVAWNGLLWVATGNGTNSIAYSADGINWTGIPSSTNTFTSGGNGIAWNGIRWVAVGNGTNAIAYSSNGINWTGIPYSSNTFTSAGFGSGIAWNGFRWVAVGNGTNIFAYSPDGINWTGVPGSSSSFTTYGVGIAWNGTRWVAVGQGTNSIAYSSDGINWTPVSGSTSIFTVYGVFVAYSSNVAPAYQQQNLDVLSQNIPTFFRSTNQMFLANSTILMNDTLIVDRAFKNVGINCNVPTVNLDVGGTIRAQTATISTLNASTMNVSSGIISSLTVPNFTAQTLLVSSLRFFDGDGTVFTADVQHSNVSTIALYASSMITNAVTAFNFVSAPLHIASSVVTNFMLASTISTQSLTTSNFFTSSATINSLTVPNFTTQRLLVSSLRFYDGDGLIQMPDMQGSNISTIAMYGSSIAVNTLTSYNYVSTANLIASTITAVYFNTNTISSANFQTSTFFSQFNSTSVLNANTASFSTMTVSTINVPVVTTQRLLVSSLRFYDGDGYVFTADVQHSNVSTIGLYASSMITNAVTAFNFISAPLHTASSVITNFMLASSISTQSLVTSNLFTSSATFSTLNVPIITTQRLLLSSIRFYDGDGYVQIPDVQNSNVSTGALYASSVTTVTASASNIRLGSNAVQTPISFFGTTGAFNNTLIAEQSTSITSQELLFFRGSSISDQFRFQTTGGFRVETGVTGRLFPNTGQLPYATFQVDAFSNVSMNSNQFYLNAASGFVGINCNTPTFNLDVNGSARTLNLTTSSIFVSTLTINTQTIASLAAQRMLVSSLRFYDGDGITFIADAQASNVSTVGLYASSMITNAITAFNFISAPLHIASTVITNSLVTSSLSAQTILTSNILTSSATIATLGVSTLTTQSLLVSSLRFYDGDGTTKIADLQSSNVSSIAIYGSSIAVNTLIAASFISTTTMSVSSLTINNLLVNNTISTTTLYASSFYSQLNSTGILNVNAGTFSSILVSTVNAPILIAQRFQVSSLRFYDGDGITFIPDIQGSNVSTMAVYASSFTANNIVTQNANVQYMYASSISTLNIITTTITTSNISSVNLYISSVLSANTMNINFGNFSSIAVSTMTIPLFTAQRALFSSLRFFDGDGFLQIPDIQNSNVSTGAVYASSITTIALAASNIRLGSNALQTPISFFGTTGSFNNTLIAEQSTSITSQELLFFRGSSISDQFRFQTTGGFRVETGVTGRLFPNTGQLPYATFLVDPFSNISMNSNQFYLNATTGFIGINCNTPAYNLDVNGSVRMGSLVISSLVNVSSFVTSTQTAANMTTQRLLVSSLRFYDGDGTTFIPDIQASNVSSIGFYASSIITNAITAFNFISTPNLITSSLVTNFLVTSSLSVQTILTSNIVTSSATIATLGVSSLTTQRLLVSSLRFFDGDGFVQMPDIQGSNISSMAIYASSFNANNIVTQNANVQYMYASSISTLTIITTTLLTSNISSVNMYISSLISANTLNINVGNFSTATMSTLNAPSLTTQRILVSSLRFYDGDGITVIRDLQSSNVSSVAMYTSSLFANTLSFNNISGLPNNAFGLNCNAPTYTLDVNGVANLSSLTRVNVAAPSSNIQRWVAVGQGTNSIAYSSDGITWTGIPSSSSTFTVIGYGVAWNGKLFVAVGTGTNAIAYSSDGISWTGIPTSSSTFTSQGNGIAWNGIRWVATGTGTNAIAYSSDGITWTGIPTSSSTFTGYGQAVAWNGIRWVAVGSGTNAIAYSSDGITWTGIPTSSNTFTTQGNGIAWNGIRWVAVGQGTNSFAYSPDGITWTGIPISVGSFSIIGYGVAWNGRLFVAAGYGSNAIAYSPDGINWTGIPYSTNTFTSSGFGTGIAWNGVRWLATGQGTNAIAYSSDGINWTGIPFSSNTFTIGGYGIAWSSNVIPSYTQTTLDILPSQNNGIPLFFRSTNQIFLAASSMTMNTTLSVDSFYNRVGINNPTPQYTLDVNGNLNVSSLTRVNVTGFSSNLQRWVAAGSGTNALAYSSDGITWTGIPTSSSTFTTQGYGVAWNGIRWVAVGSGTNAIAYSSDGINWIGIPTSAQTFTIGYGIAWNGRLWVAVGYNTGNNCVAYSYDGITWTQIVASLNTFNTQANGIAWNGRLFVAVGQGINAIAYSPDGINWSGIPYSTNTFTSNGSANGIAWSGIRWVAVGTPGVNVIAYSSDGINWTGIAPSASTFTTAGYGIAWNGRLFVAVGQGTNAIAYSPDGINWTGIPTSSSTFTTQANGIAWNGIRWVATGTGTNAIAYSFDGINWTGIPTSSNTFTTGGYGIAWSSNLLPSYTQPTLDILPSQNNGIPLFFRSTNQIFLAASSMTMNATLSVDSLYNRVGINNPTPQYTLDVNGTVNVSSLTRVNVIAPFSNIQRWVAAGLGTNALAYSSDGINWTGIATSSSTFTTQGYGVAWNGIRWVAVGSGTNSIAYSSDGINWIGIPNSASTFTTQGNGIAWNGTIWIAVGTGTNTLVYSQDGINWTVGATPFTTAGQGIAWNGTLWVAVGSGVSGIGYSITGTTSWTGIALSASTFTTQGNGIAWNGIRWVAVGSGTNSIAYSSDGINWNGIANSASTFTTQGNGIAWNGKLFVAVGQGTNAIAYSADGINWTGIPYSANTFTSAGFGTGIAWNGIRWVATGKGTNAFAYSSDGINWTGVALGATTFATSGYGIAWSSNIIPSYTQPSLDILPSQNNGIPLFFRSTNQIFLAASSMTMNATLSVDSFFNRVGINNPIPQFNLDVYGNSRISSLMIGDTPSFGSTNTTFQLSVFGTNGPARVGGTTWTQISDQRLKEQIVDADLDRCYNDIKAVPLRRFTYTSSFFNTIALPDRNVLGFIAQEVKQLHPKAITVSEGFGVSDLNWLNIDQMNMSLYGAVKRMMQTNEELTSSVAGLQITLGYCMSTITGGNV